MNDSPIFLIIFFGYLVSLVFYFVKFETPSDLLSEWGKQIVTVSLILHGVFLLALFSPRSGVAVTPIAEYAVPFLILLAAYITEWRFHGRYLVLFSLPLVLFISLLAILHSRNAHAELLTRESGWFWLHLVFILTGLAGLITAVSSAAMYLLQSKQLKSKQPGQLLSKLPPLDTLDRIHFTSLVWGVVLFSLGILSGLFSARAMGKLNEIFKDPKVILSFLSCLMFWVIFGLRLSSLRRGQKIAVGTLLIFMILFATLFISLYTPSEFHRGF